MACFIYKIAGFNFSKKQKEKHKYKNDKHKNNKCEQCINPVYQLKQAKEYFHKIKIIITTSEFKNYLETLFFIVKQLHFYWRLFLPSTNHVYTGFLYVR